MGGNSTGPKMGKFVTRFFLFFSEACRFSTPVAALKKISWTSGVVHMEVYFFIYIKGEPGQNRWDTIFLIGRHAT